jgi:hypothetical protein
LVGKLEAAGIEFTNGDQPAARLTKANVAKPTVAVKSIRAKSAKASKKKR